MMIAMAMEERFDRNDNDSFSNYELREREKTVAENYRTWRSVIVPSLKSYPMVKIFWRGHCTTSEAP